MGCGYWEFRCQSGCSVVHLRYLSYPLYEGRVGNRLFISDGLDSRGIFVGEKLCLNSSNARWLSTANAACATLGVKTDTFAQSLHFFTMGITWAKKNGVPFSTHAHQRFWDSRSSNGAFELPEFMKRYIMHVLEKPAPLSSQEEYNFFHPEPAIAGISAPRMREPMHAP